MEALSWIRKSSPRRHGMVLSLVLVLAAGMLAGCVSTGGETASPQRLLVSRSGDRSNPVGLSGAVVNGAVYVFVSSAGSVRRAEFFLDRAATGIPRQVEREAPFDFAGTRRHGQAREFDTRRLSDGYHEIAVRLTLSGGAAKKIVSRFRVANHERPGSSTSTSSTTVPVEEPPVSTPAPTTPEPTAPPSGSPSGRPTPATTGWRHTGVVLTPYSGPCVITARGTTIDSKDISCALDIRADDVKITRSRIQAGFVDRAVLQRTGNGLLIEDVEITSPDAVNVTDFAIESYDGTNMTVRRAYIHHVYRGIHPGNGTQILDSYVDENICRPGDCDTHAQAILSNGGTTGVVIRGNVLGCRAPAACTAAVSVFPETMWGPNSYWTIENNLLNGGSYCTYLGYTPSAGERPNTNMRVIGNVFGDKYFPQCGRYGQVASWTPPPTGSGNVWSGNVDAAGRVVNP